MPTGQDGGPATQSDGHRTDGAGSGNPSRTSDEVGARTPTQTLQSVKINRSVIEDFRPLYGALEWRIAQAYWARRGVLPFAQSEVPFLINNSGRLSEAAAQVVLANCLEHRPEGPLNVIEFGAGTGLFARHFLDFFRELCDQRGVDFYGRLKLFVTDQSPATVEQWLQRDLFADHHGRVVASVADAMAGTPVDGTVRAIFCNYVLDVLPATVVRMVDGTVEQLRVRTRLVDDPGLVKSYTSLTHEEISEIAASADPSALEKLFPLLSLFDFEVAFSADGLIDGCADVVRGQPEAGAAVFNFGALQCLTNVAERLDLHGFILINDYGPTQSGDVAGHATCQRFGATSALGINFPHLERHLGQKGLLVRAATGDHERPIHARLITRERLEHTFSEFEGQFGDASYHHVQDSVEEAREHVAAGRLNEALTAYTTAVSRSARDWALIGEAADFVANQVRDYGAALELARGAVALNPFYSAWLWNILGDSLYCLERFSDAHAAYLRAEEIDPRDGRTNLNLAYSFLRTGDHESALRVIARGLASDGAGAFRGALLEKQQQVIAAIAVKAAGESQRLARRNHRFAPLNPSDHSRATAQASISTDSARPPPGRP